MWLRLRQYPDGSWSLGHETIFAGMREKHWWLNINNDKEWQTFGTYNLRAIISAQEEQLRIIEAAKLVVEQREKEVEEIANAFNVAEEFLYGASESLRHIESLSRYTNPLIGIFRGDELKDAVWRKWYKIERDKRIRDVYGTADSYDFQKIAEDYTAIIQEIKTGIAHLESVCDFVQDEQDVPPVLPWLRTENYFDKEDNIIGWKASNECPPPNSDVRRFWDPIPDKLMASSKETDRVWPRSGFMDDRGEGYYFYSPQIMRVWEAQFYQDNRSYREFLMKRMVRQGLVQDFYEILASIEKIRLPIKRQYKLCAANRIY